ncbi:50S ribosomal protein L5 [Candidatus Arthromitus sp. SFB-mouse-NYU]|nr:50S ribosomal protein L5 [Candidatus Arthromitus sp. SFB-mouse-NYU]BAK80436.1 50S ribosomal protein L5 [Candidatus Arthromitus sp. SFB-mouse-Yit]
MIKGGFVILSRLKEKYINEVTSKLVEKFKYSNLMQVPKIEKVVINMGVGEAKDNSKVLESVVNDMQLISGQKPIICRAKKSISNFKLRENMPIGCKVTLRKSRMYDFIDKLFNVALPRVRDFRGVSEKSFDGRGNYTLGLKEHLIFPEIEYDKIDKIRGIEVIFVTTAKTDEEARELLRYLGMPFMS